MANGRDKSTTTPRAGNIYGRRAGRGVRPYLIVLKLLGVATFVGGLVAVLAVLCAMKEGDVQSWRLDAATVRLIFARVVVPGLIAALVFGTLLASSMWRVVIRMRWFATKMVLVVVAVPVLHVYMSTRSAALRGALLQSPAGLQRAVVLRNQMIIGTVLALGFAVAAVVLGRVKPRLGQDYARTFAAAKKRG